MSEIQLPPAEPTLNLFTPKDTQILANDLARFISENKLFHNIQGKEYVNVEGWQYAGSRLGILPQVVSLSQMIGPDDKEIRYEAKVNLVNLHTNQIIGTGYSICSNKEATKKYYQEFAIASMAQTRAIGKAYRNTIAWLIRAAGYEPTPAEEMDYAKGDSTPIVSTRTTPSAPAAKAPQNAVTSMPAATSVASFEQEVDAFKKEISNTLPASEMVTAEQIEFASKLLKSHVFTEAEKANYAKGFKAFTKTFASHRIDEIKRTLDERKAAEKAADQNSTEPDPADRSRDAYPITVPQKTTILLLLNNPAITKDEKEKMVVKINTFDTIRAEKAIIKLKAVIADRTTPAQSAA